MTRRVDEVEVIQLAIVGTIVDANRLAFNRDAALALDIHGVEQLLFHIALGNRLRHFKNAVGKRRFAMVDMGDDGEIPDMRRIVDHGLFLFEESCVHS